MASHSGSSRINLLVSRLIDRTSEETLNWDTTARDAVFIAVLSTGSVEISRHEHYDDEAGHPVEWFELVLLDPNGRVVERLSSQPELSGDDSTWFDAESLSRLFKLARAHALNASRLVDNLISELG